MIGNPTPEQILALRTSAGLTQRQAGALVWTSARQWQRWEAGETRMLRAVFECARYRLGGLSSPYGDCWVVVCPKGLYYTGLHRDEADVWRVALGWPSVDEINEHKALGWYAVTADVTWQDQNLGE